MAKCVVLACGFLLLHYVGSAVSQDEFWYPDQGAATELTVLGSENFDSTVSGNPLVVVFFSDVTSEDLGQQKMFIINQNMMKGAAAVLSDAVFGVVDTSQNIELTAAQGVTGPNTVCVYKNGKRVKYTGYRASDVLVAFVKKLQAQNVVTVITDQATQKMFDKLQSPKVLGHFDSVSPAYEVFKEAADIYYPDVRFYVTLDPLAGAISQQTSPGSVVMVTPPNKTRIQPQQPLATLQDYQAFVDAHKTQHGLRHLSAENIHGIMTEGASEPFAVAFLREACQQARQVYKALKNALKPGDVDVTVHVIDTDKLPMLDGHFRTKFGVDTSLPALGLFNLTDGNSTWFNMTQLEGVVDKVQRMTAVRGWLLDVKLGQVRVDGEPAPDVAPLSDVTQDATDTAAEPAVDGTATEAAREPEVELAVGQKAKQKRKGESTEKGEPQEGEQNEQKESTKREKLKKKNKENKKENKQNKKRESKEEKKAGDNKGNKEKDEL